MKPDGGSLIGFGSSGPGGRTFKAFDPAADAWLEPSFPSAAPEDVARAIELAEAAAPVLAGLTGAERNRFLRAIAANLETKRADLAERAGRETGLPAARLDAEIGRTALQLRLYGAAAERGEWSDPRIETAQPDRKPQAKPDHRSMLRAIGPVVVFGSSNFPFAYSVAGGDTASALAVGCPVIVKAHPAHPGTSELVGRLILHAVRDCGLPEGTFSLLFDAGFEVGQALVRHPVIKAVGFTGSTRGGRALMDLAAARPEPIPVYAEMGSTNPVFLLPGAIAERAAELVDGLRASATVGVGQFCTNPGLIVLQRSPAAEKWVAGLVAQLNQTPEAPMLTAGIHKSFVAGTNTRAEQAGVRVIARAAAGSPCGAAPVWFETDAATFQGNHTLAEEIFGPTSLVVWCATEAELLAVAGAVEGSLTGTVHAGKSDGAVLGKLMAALVPRVGRIVFNGYPTGVEVSPAIVHGGPYPSTSDGGRSTSVGTRALARWARLICYQGFPDELLPAELRNANPTGLRRMLNGEETRGDVAG